MFAYMLEQVVDTI